jgi:translocation and assembly module TamB
VWPVSAVPMEVKGRLTGEGLYQISYAMHPLDFRTRLRTVETNGLLHAELTSFYKENRADVVADFGPDGWLPVTGSLKASDFKLSADLFKMEGYSDVTGTAIGKWETNQYTLDLKAHVEPETSSANLPPADVELVAQGDTNSVRVERAVSTVPGLQLTLSDPLELSYRGKLLSERSEIQIAADLEKIPKLKLKGRVEGKILLEKGEELPTATFKAAGTNLSGVGVEAQSVDLEGRMDWPELLGMKANVRFDTHSTLALRGSADLAAKSFGETSIQAEGPVFTNFLPAGVSFKNVKFSALVEGGLTNLRHSGAMEISDFVAPQMQPLKLEASWKAQQFTFDELGMRARAGPTVIFMSGSGFAEAGRTNFEIQRLTFSKGDEEYLNLEEPARVTLTTNLRTTGVELTINPITLEGTNRHLNVSGALLWPSSVFVNLRATNVNPSLLQFFTARSLRGLDLEQLNVTGGWSNGPAAGEISGKFSMEQEPFERLSAVVDLRLDTNGLALREGAVLNPQAEIFKARGLLPVSLHPLGTNKVRVSSGKEIDFEVESTANESFWKTVSDLTELNLSNVALRGSIQGTTRRPTGRLEIRGSGIEYRQTNGVLPEIGLFEGTVVLNEQLLAIPAFSFRIEDQPVSVSGSLRLGDNFWTQRREEIYDYALNHAEVRVEAPLINLAPFTGYLPNYLRPQGQMKIEAGLLPGRNLDGRIEITEIETRPLPRVGVVQNIEARLVLEGKDVHIQNLSGVIGGETLSLGGLINISDESLGRGYPDLNLSIKGYNVPLARNPDVILRSDLDLRVRNGTNRIPVVSGTANLRDSFLLSDITKLVPGRLARPERRPPYFTVPVDPLDEWLLDVRVRGENFMRVRSPFFQGVVSANFHVSGNLREPIALGESAITSGQVIFPFAALTVRQALVSLTIENPYLPHLFMVAAGRAFGFDVRMEVEGPADEPVIEFSSVPALTSEQIVLMLTTGQIPRQDFGFSSEDRAGKLAFFLGKSLWAKLNPNKPAEERLTIRSGEDVTEQGRQTYEVEYKLNDRWSLVGEYSRFGDLNANVKWRVFSR